MNFKNQRSQLWALTTRLWHRGHGVETPLATVWTIVVPDEWWRKSPGSRFLTNFTVFLSGLNKTKHGNLSQKGQKKNKTKKNNQTTSWLHFQVWFQVCYQQKSNSQSHQSVLILASLLKFVETVQGNLKKNCKPNRKQEDIHIGWDFDKKKSSEKSSILQL